MSIANSFRARFIDPGFQCLREYRNHSVFIQFFGASDKNRLHSLMAPHNFSIVVDLALYAP
jgi:hypothetical protein